MKKVVPISEAPGSTSGEAPPTWRDRKFSKIEHVRLYLGSLINRVESGELDDQRAARLANIGNILAGLLQGSDLEKRLKALEEKLGSKPATPKSKYDLRR